MNQKIVETSKWTCHKFKTKLRTNLTNQKLRISWEAIFEVIQLYMLTLAIFSFIWSYMNSE